MKEYIKISIRLILISPAQGHQYPEGIIEIGLFYTTNLQAGIIVTTHHSLLSKFGDLL